MEQAKLEERIAELEKQVANMKRRIDMLSRPNDWRGAVGMFAGDEVMKRIDEEGRKIREKDREHDQEGNARQLSEGQEMILLDTDHLTILKYPENLQCARLTARMASSNDQDFTTTIVSAEEQLRGWLAEIHRQRMVQEQVPPYERLRNLLDFLRMFHLIDFDKVAANEFDRLRRMKVRISTMDLKNDCIALVQDALLLSANLRDFRQVPGLRVEDWLKE